MSNVLLPPGVNPIAIKYHIVKHGGRMIMVCEIPKIIARMATNMLLVDVLGLPQHLSCRHYCPYLDESPSDQHRAALRSIFEFPNICRYNS